MAEASSFTDDYVASVLKRDAKADSAKYSTLGVSALLPQRKTGSAPRPNVRFLKNILRDTDNHNAALLAKEQREARARERRLERGLHGRLSPPRQDEKLGTTSKHRDAAEERRRHRTDDGERRRRHRGDGSRSRSRSRSPRRKKRRRDESGERASEDDEEARARRRRRHRHHRHRSGSRERKPHREHSDRPRRPPSPTTSSHPQHRQSPPGNEDDVSSSDPLESLVGPLPPPPGPPVRSRGRGTYSRSTMDAHFDSSYDPSEDTRPASEDDGDDWEQALEAMRDRAQWKRAGAERLRAAGFGEGEVRKWEAGSGLKREAGEDLEGSVKWRGKGEGREWDRGKVVSEGGDGLDVDVKAAWGRLGAG